MNVVFDTQVLLILYLGERGAEQVADIIRDVQRRKIRGYVNVVNLAELYYILGRRSREVAEEKERNLRSFGIRIVPVRDDALWRQAAAFKTKHPLSLADAFAAATAKVLDAKLVAGGDPEFDRLGIELLRIGVSGSER